MRSRCRNQNDIKNWKHYGGRGIRVCAEWDANYLTFKSWALSNGYKDRLTLDRINNDGNYEPSNCRWVTNDVQLKNRRKNGVITAFTDEELLAELKKRGIHCA